MGKANSTPRRKRLKKAGRLRQGREWLKINGKSGNLIRRYARWFGVPRLCAALELTLLGVQIPPEVIEKEKAIERQKAEQGRRAREKRLAKEQLAEDWGFLEFMPNEGVWDFLEPISEDGFGEEDEGDGQGPWDGEEPWDDEEPWEGPGTNDRWEDIGAEDDLPF